MEAKLAILYLKQIVFWGFDIVWELLGRKWGNCVLKSSFIRGLDKERKGRELISGILC